MDPADRFRQDVLHQAGHARIRVRVPEALLVRGGQLHHHQPRRLPLRSAVRFGHGGGDVVCGDLDLGDAGVRLHSSSLAPLGLKTVATAVFSVSLIISPAFGAPFRTAFTYAVASLSVTCGGIIGNSGSTTASIRQGRSALSARSRSLPTSAGRSILKPAGTPSTERRSPPSAACRTPSSSPSSPWCPAGRWSRSRRADRPATRPCPGAPWR